MVEVYVIFRGEVQGVCFRASAREMAQQLDLLGTVKNLPDGTVELVAQGPENKIEQLIERLKEKYHLYSVMSVEVIRRPISRPFSGFSIIY